MLMMRKRERNKERDSVHQFQILASKPKSKMKKYLIKILHYLILPGIITSSLPDHLPPGRENSHYYPQPPNIIIFLKNI